MRKEEAVSFAAGDSRKILEEYERQLLEAREAPC